MKKMNLFAIVMMMAVFALSSCGAKKQLAQNGYYQQQPYAQQSPQQNPYQQQPTYQQPPQQSQQPQQSARPTRTKREVEPCIAKALDPTATNLRMYGTYTSYVEQEAISVAIQNARQELGGIINASVEGVLSQWVQSSQVDQRVTTDLLNGRDYTTYIAEQIAMTPPIETSVYDLSDGKIQVYVCIEMRTSQNELTNNISKTIQREVSEDETLRQKFDQQQFKEQHKQGLEEYKKQRRLAEGL